MPTITLSKKELLKTVGKKLSDEELSNRISMLGTDLEGIEDDEITVEIFPNRPDLLSQQGFGRALASFIGTKPGLAKFKVNKPKIDVFIDKSTQDCRPFTVCAVVRNLKLDDDRIKEIIQIQEKLHITYGRNRKKMAIGIYPLESIKTPIYFKGLKPSEIKFRPLEAAGKMSAKEILEEHPKGKDYAHLLEGLKHYACFMDANNNIMSLTPIINSHLTGKVDENTTDVFIECSGFDFRTLEIGLNMIVACFADMGANIEACTLHYPDKKIITPNLEPTKHELSIDYVNKVLGIELKEKDLKRLLEKMGFGYDGKVLVPAYRNDILHEIDFVEDIAIAYGYENFTPEIPNVSTVGEESWASKVDNKLRELFIGLGLLEVKNYHLVSEEVQKLLGYEVIRLKNSLSSGYDSMRVNPLGSLLQTLRRNMQHEYPQKIFEIGRGFMIDNNLPSETRYLSAILAGDGSDYTSIRQLVDAIALAFDIKLEFVESEVSWALSGRSAIIKLDKKVIGELGEVHPRIITELGLEVPCAAFNLNIEEL